MMGPLPAVARPAWPVRTDRLTLRPATPDDAGATWSAPVRADGGTPAGHADVEIVAGGALVSWIERTRGGPAELRVRRCREAFRAEVARAAARHEPYRPFPEPMNLMDSTASAT